jgi:uncharacterized lipoprotein YajG
MKRPALAALVIVLTALLVAGCGGSSDGSSSTAPKQATSPNAPAGSKVVSCGADQLRVTEVDCATARRTMEQWQSSGSCSLAKDVSRNSCSVAGFRCQAANVGEGISVSCVGTDGDVAFVVKPAG